jgi:hypothetical protein
MTPGQTDVRLNSSTRRPASDPDLRSLNRRIIDAPSLLHAHTPPCSSVFNQRRELVLEGMQKFLIRRRPYAELLRRLVAGQAAGLNPGNHALTKIHRMVCPSMLASSPASMLNQNSPDLGIPNRISLKTSRSRHLFVDRGSIPHLPAALVGIKRSPQILRRDIRSSQKLLLCPYAAPASRVVCRGNSRMHAHSEVMIFARRDGDRA